MAAAAAEDKVVLSVEVCVRQDSRADLGTVKAAALAYLLTLPSVRYAEALLAPPPGQHPLLDAHVQSMRICDIGDQLPHGKLLLQWDVAWTVLAFQLDGEGPADDDEGDEAAPSYREWALPAADFHGLWESLHYESGVQRRLLRYAASALLFAERRVSPRLVSWNRVVLLHGPPGTGKTSLCQALAQKLTIRLADRYPGGGVLIEVNAHSLFSKWFSESGKLVARLFAKIQEVVDEADTLVFVLIDEVESLTAARKAAAGGSEPADAIRAVNALLTRLDALRAAPNAMVLTTSNITQAIDLAFVDRADIKAYVGNPGPQARYEILRSCFAELQKAGIVGDSTPLLPFSDACCTADTPPDENRPANGASGGGGSASQPSSCCSMDADGGQDAAQRLSRGLLEVAQAADGFSGRTLRKLPFLAHAAREFPSGCCTSQQFVGALTAAVERERDDRDALGDAA